MLDTKAIALDKFLSEELGLRDVTLARSKQHETRGMRAYAIQPMAATRENLGLLAVMYKELSVHIVVWRRHATVYFGLWRQEPVDCVQRSIDLVWNSRERRWTAAAGV